LFKVSLRNLEAVHIITIPLLINNKVTNTIGISTTVLSTKYRMSKGKPFWGQNKNWKWTAHTWLILI